MRPPTHISPRSTTRSRALSRAVQARRRLERGGGRAWINGREVGGTDARFGYLAESHD